MHLIFALLPILAALDHGGRYLHTQTFFQVAAAGLLLLSLKSPKPASPLGRWLLPWALALVLTGLFSVSRILSLEEIARWTLYLLLPYLIWRLVPVEKQRTALVILFWGAILVAAIGWLYRSPLGDFVGTLDRTNDLAAFLLPFVPLGLGLWNGRKSWLLVLGSSFLALTILLTASRAALLALVVALLVFVALRTPKRHVLWLVLTPLLVVPFLPALWHKLQSAWAAGLAENSLAWRLSMWKGTWQIFLDHPVVGTGPGTFLTVFHRYQEQAGYYSVNPHSQVLQILAETGLVGALAFLIFLAGIGWLTVKLKPQQPALAAAAAGAAVASLLHACFDIDYSVSAIPMLLMTLLGLAALSLPADRRVRRGWWGVPVAVCLIVLPSLNLISARLLARAEASQDPVQAENLYRRALSTSLIPSAGAHGAYAAFLMKQGRLQEAEPLLHQARASDASNSRYLTLMGQLAVQQGKLMDAATHFQAAIKLNPYRHPSLYGDLAYVYLKQNKREAALQVLEQGVLAFPLEQLPRYQSYTPQDRPQLGVLYQTLSHLYREAGRTAEAEKTATIARGLLPTDPP